MPDLVSNVVELFKKRRERRNRGGNKDYQIKSPKGMRKSYCVVIRLKEGKDTKSFPTRELAEEWAKRRVLEIKHSQEPSVRESRLKEWTIRKLIDDYIAFVPDHDFIGHKPRKRSWKDDNVRLKRICTNHDWLVDKPLSVLTDDDFTRWRNDRLNGLNGVTKIGADAFIQEVSSVRYLLYHYARTVKLIHAPKFQIDLPSSNYDRDRRDSLTTEEFNAIFNEALRCRYATVGLQWRTYLHLALNTGVRPGALFRIIWGDIRWSDDPREPNGYYQIADKQKAGKELKKRYIPLSLDMIERLKDYRLHIPEHMRGNDKTLFWNSRHKNKFEPVSWQGQWSRVFRDFRKRAGIAREVSPHWMRHTAHNRFETMGMLDTDIEYMLGHAHRGGSHRAYRHKDFERIRDCIDPGWRDRPTVAQQKLDKALTPHNLQDENFWAEALGKGGKIAKQHSEPDGTC